MPLAAARPAINCLPPPAPDALLQLATLTRLHTLHLSSLCDSDEYEPLRAHSSTLQSLCLHNCSSLPKFLPRMLALRTLVSLWH